MATRKYALFSARFNPEIGGVERFTENMARELASRGHEVTVVTCDLGAGVGFERFDDRIQVLRMPSWSILNGRLPVPNKGSRYNAYIRALEHCGIDRVLVNTRFYPLSLNGLRFAKRINAPVALLDHGSEHLSYGSSEVLDAAIRKYEHFVTEITKRYQPAYCGVSERSVEWLRHFGIENARVVPNAIDVQAYESAASHRDFRKEFEIGNGLLAAFVGRIAPEKGPSTLLWAHDQINSNDFHCILAGEGPQKELLSQSASNNVHFTGSLSAPDIAALLQQADMLVLPSVSEGFATVLLEASACATPAVVTDVGGAREVTDNARYGFIASDHSPQAFLSALCDAISVGNDARREMGAVARKHVEQCYSWASSADELESLFDAAEQGVL